jgi:hypothetical protein
MTSISSKRSRHNFFINLLFVLICAALVFAAPQQNPIAGHWEGVIKLPTGALNFSVDFTVAADGKPAATITIPQQGAKDLPPANVGFTNGEVTFALPNVPGDPKFRGKLSADGQKIEGTFSQGRRKEERGHACAGRQGVTQTV